MLYVFFFARLPEQVVSLAKAKSVPANMREFLSWAQRHHRIDVTATIVEAKQAGRHLLVRAQVDAKIFLIKVRVLTCKICGAVRREERHPPRQDPASCSHRRMDHRESNAHTRRTYCVDCGTYIYSVPREVWGALEATRSASSNRNEELADRVSRDTTITKQPIDLVTRLMEQVSRLSDGDYHQSVMVQFFLDCVDRTTASSTAFVSFRVQPMQFNDNQTPSLRVVDPIADEGVWAIIDDGCNSCCHGEVLRQNAEMKMKVLGFHPFWLHGKANYFQWRWNLHDKWKVENTNGHTTAGI